MSYDLAVAVGETRCGRADLPERAALYSRVGWVRRGRLVGLALGSLGTALGCTHDSPVSEPATTAASSTTAPVTAKNNDYENTLRGWRPQELQSCVTTAFFDAPNVSFELTAQPVREDMVMSETQPIGTFWSGRVKFGTDMDLDGRCSDLLPEGQPQPEATWLIETGEITFDIGAGEEHCRRVTGTLSSATVTRPDTGAQIPIADVSFDVRMPFYGIDGCYYP
jgi:hypothetical protein